MLNEPMFVFRLGCNIVYAACKNVYILFLCIQDTVSPSPIYIYSDNFTRAKSSRAIQKRYYFVLLFYAF